MLADLTVARATTGVGAPAVSVGSGNSRPMSTDVSGPERPTDRDAQPTYHAVCHDCDEFELVHEGDRGHVAETVRFHRAANPEHSVELAEVAD